MRRFLAARGTALSCKLFDGFRVKAIAVAGLLLILATASFSQSVFAQTGCDCWRNSKTGEAVGSAPLTGDVPGRSAPRDLSDLNRAFDPKTGNNYHLDQSCTWRNSKTGEAVGSAPLTGDVPGRTAPRDLSDLNRAFDPKTGNNYHRIVPCPPQTTATTPPPVTTTPAPAGVGLLIVEPKVSFGFARRSSTSGYDSTGGQAPFSGDSSKTGGQVSGGVSIGTGIGGNNTVMIDFSVNTHPGQTFFSIPRHAGGLVTLDASSTVVIDTLIKGQIAVGPSNNFFLSAGIGPSLRKLDFTLTSNQSAFGGGMPTTSQSKWQTGLAVSAGVATFACSNCVAGNPLKIGIEGRARRFSSRSIGLTSPAFGFTETGSTGRTTDYSVLITVGVPFTISDVRVKRDISQVGRLDNGIALYRYRYVWSDQVYVGVMAQEVANIIPDAVARGADGYLRVDYQRLGLSFMTWEEWVSLAGG